MKTRNIIVYYTIMGQRHCYTDTNRFSKCREAVDHFSGEINRNCERNISKGFTPKIYARFGKV